MCSRDAQGPSWLAPGRCWQACGAERAAELLRPVSPTAKLLEEPREARLTVASLGASGERGRRTDSEAIR
eukprot:scaffold1277_cov253-Pinguiococcus_pyrenoidosus.AAC.12